jgi:hydroxymethylbilane synthase
MTLRIGARASALARWQAEWVAAQLRQCGLNVEFVPIVTTGDHRQEPIESIGGQGVFTKEIQRALLDGRIDLAIHSLKDLPTDAVPGLCVAAVPERASAHDALVCPRYASIDALPQGAVVGTSSLRRRSQLLHFRPDLQTQDIRGNVETRLRKLDRGEFDAIILAEAGLQRLGLADRITQSLPLSLILPAAGQGALGLETRDDDEASRRIVAPLNHPPTHAAVLAERAMLSAIYGGCLTPVAALARAENGRLTLTGRVLSRDGRQMLQSTQESHIAEPESLGRQVADQLLAQGAGQLIRASRDIANDEVRSDPTNQDP